MTDDPIRYPLYRWINLSLAWTVLMCLAWSWFLVPSLSFRLFPEWGLTHMQFTLIFTAPFLTAIFLSIPGGFLGDRYGIRLIVAIGAIILALAGSGRVLATGFASMFFLMCLLGVSVGCILPNLPKLVKTWFPPNEVGLASGIYMTALGVGAGLGLFSGPQFGSWKIAFCVTGLLMLIAGIVWLIYARECPEGCELHHEGSVGAGILRVMKSRNIWLVATGQFLFFGAYVSFSENLPPSLQSVYQLSPKTAGVIAALLNWGLVGGNLVIPMLSDRVGLRKPFIYFCTLAGSICLWLGWKATPGISTGAWIFAGGLIAGGVQPILFALPVELPEVGSQNVGGAAGLVNSLMMLGGFVVPLVVISPVISAGKHDTGFAVAALMIAAVACLTLLLKETGRTRRGA